VGAELLHVNRWTDGRIDMTKLIVSFFAILLTRLQTTAAEVLKKFLDFTEHEGSIPCTQKPVILSLAEREDSSLRPHINFL